MRVKGGLEKLAKEIAEKANECCHRSDGYEEDICAIALKALEKAVSLPHWIPIRDQEPPKGKPVLITDGKIVVVSLWTYKCEGSVSAYRGVMPATPKDSPPGEPIFSVPIVEYQWRRYGVYFYGDPLTLEWWFKNYEITHWMPLPALPRKEVITDDSKR